MQLHRDPELDRAARFALLVLVSLEEQGLVPQRFTPASLAAWHGIMPHSRELDLFELAVRDGQRANPHLFAAFAQPDRRNDLRALEDDPWRQELLRLQSIGLAGMPALQLYLLAAETLGIDLPDVTDAPLHDRHFDRSSLVAEAPDGCGYPSLLLCQSQALLDAAHNLRIFVSNTPAQMLSAWALVLLTHQLALPPDRIIAVSATDCGALTSQPFDALLLYRPVDWLTPAVRAQISVTEVIAL